MNGNIKKYLSIIFLALPVLGLFIKAISWLRYGVDLPLYDDWRGYATGKMHSLDLRYLFSPVNDTLTPIGFAFDALAQRYLDGNSIAYQFISMITVLGVLLILQWKLLLRALENYFLATACFAFTLLMLQPGSYWGQQNMAYHQALPLIFLLICIWIVFFDKAIDVLRLPLLFILSLAAGFSYISGAFCMLTAGGAIAFISKFYSGVLYKKKLNDGLIIFFSGAFSSAIQYSVALNSVDSHGTGVVIASPSEMNFWWFFLGKIGKSLALPLDYLFLSQCIAIIMCFLVAISVVYIVVKKISSESVDGASIRVGFIFVVVSLVVFVYLGIISAGRLNLKPQYVYTADQVFEYGFERFHFFWATILWPWMAAVVFICVKKFKLNECIKDLFVILITLAFVLIFAKNKGFSHSEYFEAGMRYRVPTINCLLDNLQQDSEINCPEFFISDFRPLYSYAVKTGASFIRNFPILPAVRDGNGANQLYYKNNFTLKDIQGVEEIFGDSVFRFSSKKDSQLTIEIENKQKMSECLVLEVNVNIQAEFEGFSQLFFKGSNDLTYSEYRSKILNLKSKDIQKLSFIISSKNGFSNFLRFDPVGDDRKFNILSILVRCRLLDYKNKDVHFINP